MRVCPRLASWYAVACSFLVVLAIACAPSTPAGSVPAPTPSGGQPSFARQATPQPATKPADSGGQAAIATSEPESLDALYEKAKQEGGTVVFYGPLAQVNAQVILPRFEQRFPGITIQHIDATSEQLVARVLAEARGGKVLGDVFQSPLNFVAQVRAQDLLLDWLPPEAAAYPDALKGSYWVASDATFLIMAWNTNLVSEAEEPKGFEDLADPKWRGRLMADATDPEMLIAFSKHKFRDEERALELLRQIAANEVQFYKGHSELAEYLVAGQGALCWTCYSHHYPPRIEKGAPLDYYLGEGVGLINGTAVFKDAPHPNAAKLLARWMASEEGQQAFAEGGRTPAHPRVEPIERTRPETIYALTVEDYQEFPRYEARWKEIFQLR